MKKKDDSVKKALDDLESLSNKFTKAFALAIYISMIPNMIKIVNESKLDKKTKDIMICAIVFPLIGIPAKQINKIKKVLESKYG
jgi:hypothetical protein